MVSKLTVYTYSSSSSMISTPSSPSSLSTSSSEESSLAPAGAAEGQRVLRGVRGVRGVSHRVIIKPYTNWIEITQFTCGLRCKWWLGSPQRRERRGQGAAVAPRHWLHPPLQWRGMQACSDSNEG